MYTVCTLCLGGLLEQVVIVFLYDLLCTLLVRTEYNLGFLLCDGPPKLGHFHIGECKRLHKVMQIQISLSRSVA